MNHLKNFDLFNEGFLDLFKSKEPKRLTFTEEEMRYITDELSDLISNFDAQHSKGDVTTKHMIAKKAKKEYSIIDLYCQEYYSRSEPIINIMLNSIACIYNVSRLDFMKMVSLL